MATATRKYTTLIIEGNEMVNHIAIREAFDGYRVRIEIRKETGMYDSTLVSIESLDNNTAATKWLKKHNFLQFA